MARFASESVSIGMKVLCLASLPMCGVRKVWKGAGGDSGSSSDATFARDSGGSSFIVLARLTSTSLPFPFELGPLASDSGML